jgi:hypothetical protein
VIDKPTATRNLKLALVLSILGVLIFAATMIVGVIVSHG